MVAELLVCLDGSARSIGALAVAAALAPPLGAEVSVVTITAPGVDTWTDRAWLDERCADAHVHPRRRIVLPADDTIGALIGLAEPGTVLAMTTHGHTALLDSALGGTCAGVLAGTPRPVLVVGPRVRPPGRFDVVQICVDGSDHSSAAVAQGAAWASRLSATPWLVTVEPPSVGDPVGVGNLERAIKELRGRGLRPEWDVLHGDDVAAALADAAAKLEPAVVVAATHGRSGLRQAVLGSVAGGLVRHCTRPVLLVGPELH